LTKAPDSGLTDREGKWLLEHPMEGIDIEAALKLYGNSGEAFMPILKSFVAHTPSLLERMDAHLESSLPEYAIEAHGLKGTCNVICAFEAAELAKELEYASKEGKGDFVKAWHGELRRRILGLTEQLKVLLEEQGMSLPEKERRSEPGRELLIRLSAAAGEFYSNKTEEILEELERYRYDRGSELVRWLREQAENFDYEAMHRRLEEFLNDPR
jgi:HPt (histidine-containing phosphotransfer) domain-containing protein